MRTAFEARRAVVRETMQTWPGDGYGRIETLIEEKPRMPPRPKPPTEQSLNGIARVIEVSVAPHKFLVIAIGLPVSPSSLDDGTIMTNMSDGQVLDVLAGMIDKIRARRR